MHSSTELEPEPDPVPSEPSNLVLSKASLSSYQAATNCLPPHDLKANLPPPYPDDSPGPMATASLAPQATIYTPLTVPDYPQTEATASSFAYPLSWTNPA